MLTHLALVIEERPTRVLQTAAIALVAFALLGGGVVSAAAPQAPSGPITDALVLAQLIAAVLTLGLLLASLRGFVAASLPVTVGAVAVVAGLGLLRLVAELATTSILASSMVAAVTIALAIPWTLYVLARFREELAAGYPAADAASRTVPTTGRTIAFSATTIIAALLGLLVVPRGDVRATAVAMMLAVAVTALAAVAVLPAVLALLGHRVDRLGSGRGVEAGVAGEPGESAGVGRRLTMAALDHPMGVVVVLGAVFLALAAPWVGVDLVSLTTGDPGDGRLPLVIIVAVVATLLVLVIELNSLVVPLKAMASALLTLCLPFGLLAWVVADGNLADLLGVEQAGSVDPTIAAVLFVLGLGLTLESQIYVLTEIKDEHDRTGEDRPALEEGVRQSRGLVSVASWGMVAVLLAFTMPGALSARQVAIGVALAVLAQVTVGAWALLPALLQLGSGGNWASVSVVQRLHSRLGLSEHVDLMPAAADAPAAAAKPPRKPAAKPAAKPTVKPAEPTAKPAAAAVSPEPAATEPEKAPTRVDSVGAYRLVRSLGRDHHSETFVAQGPARQGALYAAVRLFDDAQVPADFARARTALERYAEIQSPHLARLFDVGLWEGHLYYGMEFVPLGSLSDPVHPLTAPDKVKAAAGAARGMQALHEAGLLHRDVRPRTVLLAPEGGKLAGLGVVQMLAEERRDLATAMQRSDAHHRPVSDPAYVAPGILAGADATVATELFALGATLHTALTGTSLFGVLPEDLAKRREHVLTSPLAISASLSDAEQQMIQRLVGVEEDLSLDSAAAAADALDALADQLHTSEPAV